VAEGRRRGSMKERRKVRWNYAHLVASNSVRGRGQRLDMTSQGHSAITVRGVKEEISEEKSR